MSAEPAVVIFARAPVPGQAKTRLIPALGPEGAAGLYRSFLLDTLAQAADLPARVVVAAAAAEDAGPVEALVREACPRADVVLQVGPDLGQRMAHAFDQAFAHGHPCAVIIGSDAPTLPQGRVRQALSLLRGPSDVALGPCFDGGYYLIGLRAPIPQLFQQIEWGARTVLADTLRRAKAAGARVSLLDPWYDVDTPDSLETLRSHLAALSLAGDSMPCPATWRYIEEHLPKRRHMPERAPRIAVIIPALNEEQSIGLVLDAIPKAPALDIVVVDNGSRDRTAEVAAAHGARVVREPRRGYGSACLAGIAALQSPDIVAFLDADLSDDPALLAGLTDPIVEGRADLVIGSRMLGERQPGALPPHTVFGNWLAGRILTRLYGQPSSDLGPFRAIRCSALQRLQMADRGYGWTIEMQAKAARLRLPTMEIPVPYRKRVGRSKITGTLSGSTKAAIVILATAFRLLRWRPRPAS